MQLSLILEEMFVCSRPVRCLLIKRKTPEMIMVGRNFYLESSALRQFQAIMKTL